MDGLRNLNSNEPAKKRGHINGMKNASDLLYDRASLHEEKTLQTHALYQLPEEASCKVQNWKAC